MFSIAAYMPLFGKKRRELEAQVKALRMDRVMLDNAWDEIRRLRQYIDLEMKRHFEVYNGGMIRQMQQMAELRLPTPWVPATISQADAVPDKVPFNTITYVREQRMVPISQAGKV